MKILIVKLGALGDVLRTTPVLTGLRRRHPDAHITWVVDRRCREVLERNRLIDRLLDYSPESLSAVQNLRFDLAVNLDKEEEALETISSASADKKMGFGRSKDGRLCPLDASSEYAYRLGVDDELKFRLNQKTYQEICFEQLGLSFQKEEYVFELDRKSEVFALGVLKKLGMDPGDKTRQTIGLNTGAGNRFAGKKLPLPTLVSLAERFHDELGAAVILLGGEDERERNGRIQAQAHGKAIDTGSHSIRRFAAIVKNCDAIVTGDTTAMHIAIAVKTPVAVYFGSTCAAEIELYGRGRKLVSELPCAPCYKKICPIQEKCMTDMSADELFSATKALLGPAK